MSFASMGIEGQKELQSMLSDFAPRQAESLLRGTVQSIATKTAKEIRQAAPKGEQSRLKKAKNIKAVRRRPVGDAVFSDVRADARDAFFWRFAEYGQGPGQTAQPFVNPTIERLRPTLPNEYRTQFMKRLEKALAKRANRV